MDLLWLWGSSLGGFATQLFKATTGLVAATSFSWFGLCCVGQGCAACLTYRAQREADRQAIEEIKEDCPSSRSFKVIVGHDSRLCRMPRYAVSRLLSSLDEKEKGEILNKESDDSSSLLKTICLLKEENVNQNDLIRLIRAGGDPLLKGKDNISPLMLALSKANKKVASIMLENRVPPFSPEIESDLIFSCSSSGMVYWLLYKAKIDLSDQERGVSIFGVALSKIICSATIKEVQRHYFIAKGLLQAQIEGSLLQPQIRDYLQDLSRKSDFVSIDEEQLYTEMQQVLIAIQKVIVDKKEKLNECNS